MIKFNYSIAHMCYLGLMLVYIIVIVCIVFLALRDFGRRHFISTVLLLLSLLLLLLLLLLWPTFLAPGNISSYRYLFL